MIFIKIHFIENIIDIAIDNSVYIAIDNAIDKKVILIGNFINFTLDNNIVNRSEILLNIFLILLLITVLTVLLIKKVIFIENVIHFTIDNNIVNRS